MRDSLARIMTTKKRINITTSRRNIFFLGILGILCLVEKIESAPLSSESSRLESTGTLASGLPSKKGQEEEVGNPSELAWQAWLLVDGHQGSQSSGGLDSASLLRRITPKSIFIAPALPACAEGYQADTMNRCVKNVNIDQEAHIDFLVQRLNAMYANVGKPHASPSSSSGPSGPFQLNIPLLMGGPLKNGNPLKVDDAETQNSEKISATTLEPSKIVVPEKIEETKMDSNHQDAIVTVYELNEDNGEDESTFFLGNKSSESSGQIDKNSSTRPGLVVPVAEFVDEANTNLSGIVDYKIPAAIEKMFNRTRHDGESIDSSSGNGETTYEETPDRTNDSELNKESNASPTLVLLLSPTKLPSISVPSTDLIVAHNSSLGQVIIKMENVTGNLTGKEIIRVSVPDSVTSSSASPTKILSDVDEDSTTHSKIDESQTDFVSGEEKNDPLLFGEGEQAESGESTETYDEENYEESTEMEDEILKHSEAGMTVTIPATADRVGKPDAQKFPSESNISDKETTGSSKISSEVSINGDFVRETTLVDFNVSKTPNSNGSTSSNQTNRSKTHADESSSKVAQDTRKILQVVEPEVGTSFGDLRTEKRDGRPSKVEENRFVENLRGKIDQEISGDVASVEDIAEDVVSGVKINKTEKMPIVVFPVSSIEDGLEDSIWTGTSSTEKSDSAETMIAASTNDAGTLITRGGPKFEISSSLNGKRAGQPFRFGDESTTNKITSTSRPLSTSSNVEGVYDYEPVPRDYPRRNPYGVTEDENIPVIRTIDEQRYRPDSSFDLPSREHDDDDQRFFGAQQQDYVRFPNYDRRERPNYVRFPSEEANSIHSSNDYKERNRRPYNQQNYGRFSPTPKNPTSQEIHQKQSYWWLPPGWRTDRQQLDHQQEQQGIQQRSRSSIGDRSRERAPMLLRFWTRMPLVRDPSLSYQHPTYPTPGADRRATNSRSGATARSSSSSSSSSRGASRRVNYYKEMSTQDLTRAFARKSVPSAIGG